MKLTRENLKQLINEALTTIKENLNQAPTYVLYYDDGTEKVVTLNDEEWHLMYDADPAEDPVEVLRGILNPGLIQGLEDAERVDSLREAYAEPGTRRKPMPSSPGSPAPQLTDEERDILMQAALILDKHLAARPLASALRKL